MTPTWEQDGVLGFCFECHVSFVLVERFPDAPNTCTQCAEKLRPSTYGECEECHRIIEKGERFHLEWTKWCVDCTRKINRRDGEKYKCESIAR